MDYSDNISMQKIDKVILQTDIKNGKKYVEVSKKDLLELGKNQKNIDQNTGMFQDITFFKEFKLYYLTSDHSYSINLKVK